jgi:peptidoglycan hydrolase-like protein with peptidoglycan-binding domain
MACEWTHRPHLLIAALAAVLVALWIPTTSHAAERDTLASAGRLEQGSGYEKAGGSDAVRTVQRRLRRLGNQPGPIDGMYGPLTQGAVERFQQRRGLAVDGIVGRQTRRSLFTRTSQPTASTAQQDRRPGTLARKSPAPSTGAESAGEQPHARPLPAGAASRAGPAPGNGIPPEVIAALAALAALLLLLTLRRQGEVRLNLGLTCAALLGVFGIGAVAGALFATRAAPHGTDRATAQSGLLLAGGPGRASAHRTASATRWAHARLVRVPTQLAAAQPRRGARASSTAPHAASSAPSATALAPVALALAPATSPVAPLAPAAPVRAAARAPVRSAEAATYVVQPGDSLSNIARRRLDPGSDETVVAEVQKLADLNLGDRIRSGDPNVLEAGEELRLR